MRSLLHHKAYLNKFSHDLLTVLMALAFEDFIDLCIKDHDMEIHLDKHRKSAKKGGRTDTQSRRAVVPKERVTYVLGCLFQEECSVKMGNINRHCSAIAQDSYKAVSTKNQEKKCLSLQERQQCEYSYTIESDWEFSMSW